MIRPARPFSRGRPGGNLGRADTSFSRVGGLTCNPNALNSQGGHNGRKVHSCEPARRRNAIEPLRRLRAVEGAYPWEAHPRQHAIRGRPHPALAACQPRQAARMCLPSARSAWPSIQRPTASRSWLEVSLMDSRMSAWDSTSLCSTAGRWVISHGTKPRTRPRRTISSTRCSRS